MQCKVHIQSNQARSLWKCLCAVSFITHMVLDAVTTKSSIEVPSGPGLPRIPIKGLLMLEGRKIISLTKNPLNIQPQCQMGRSQLHQTLLLSISNQGMMMVQPQANLCQDSTLMTLLEGLFIIYWRQWGEPKGKSHQKSG